MTEGNNQNNSLPNLFKWFREAVKEVPVLKYGWGVIGIVIILSIIGALNLKKIEVPIYCILEILGVMVLIFVFTIIATKNKNDPWIRFPFLLLVYTVVLALCLAIIFYGIYVFTGKQPKSFAIFYHTSNSVVNADSTIALPRNTPVTTGNRNDASTKQDRHIYTSRARGGETTLSKDTSAPGRRFQGYPKPDLTIPNVNNYREKLYTSRASDGSCGLLGKEAFLNEEYAWSINFFRQCIIIDPTGVWVQYLPYYAGDYFMTGHRDLALNILKEMNNMVGVNNTYLGNRQGVGVLLNSLDDVAKRLNGSDQALMDDYIDKITDIKNRMVQ